MSFIGVIGTIGTAIGTAATTIGAPLAAAIGPAGLGLASAGTASTIGTVAGATAIGSASGAALSAATGGDPGQGAWMGAVTGGVTAGAGAALGGSGGAAGGITGPTGQAVTATQPSVDAITKGIAAPGFEQAAKGIQGAAEVAALDPSVSAITKGVATPAFQQASQAAAANAAGASGLGALFGDVGKTLGKEAAMEGLKFGYGELQTQGYNDEVDELNRRHAQGYADGGLATLKGGGSIKMVDGQYVIPADVVSALGNGSSKAGAKFLREAFSQIRAQGGRKPGKAPKKAGALAHKRMMERRSKNKAA